MITLEQFISIGKANGLKYEIDANHHYADDDIITSHYFTIDDERLFAFLEYTSKSECSAIKPQNLMIYQTCGVSVIPTDNMDIQCNTPDELDKVIKMNIEKVKYLKKQDTIKRIKNL